MVIPTEFEWDDDKAESNLTKHRISFDEALAVFLDPNLLVINTSRVVEGEAREKALGTTKAGYSRLSSPCAALSAA